MQIVNTIFWDLDGTLVNNEDLYDQAIAFACNQIGCTMLHSTQELPNGQTLQEDFRFIAELDGDHYKNKELLNNLVSSAIQYMKIN